MKEFLEKIRLIEHLTTEVEIQKSEFVATLERNVDKGGLDFFSDAFDVFSSSKNEYKGHVGPAGFKIKKRRRLFDMHMSLAVASGSYRQRDEKLVIETEINGFSGIMIPFYLFAILFYSIFIVAFIFTDGIKGDTSWFALPFILLHAAFMFGIPYFIMRRSAKRMKHDLEREFYYLTKK